MDSVELKDFVNSLGLPTGRFVLFGGALLSALKIRSANDLDLFVDDFLFKQLADRGWEKKSIKQRPPYLVHAIDGISVQAFNVWEGGNWSPDIKRYIEKPELIDGLPFMPLAELYEWKAATRRNKDLIDMAMIENYLAARLPAK